MTTALQDTAPPPLTYADYLADGVVAGRYDILDGVRIATNRAHRHQTIALNIAEVFKRYARAGKHDRAYIAPVDVLISQVPLRTRQPDVQLISLDRLA